MAVPTEAKFAVIKIYEGWSDFHLQHDDKVVWLYGSDGETVDHWTNELDKDILLSGLHLYRSDNCFHEIDSEAWDDEGNKYLIIKRTPYDD